MKKAMMGLMMLLAVSIVFAQKKETNKPAPKDSTVQAQAPALVMVTDSTSLLSYKDVSAILQYLQDKTVAKDYLLVEDALKKVLEAKAQKVFAELNEEKKKPAGK